MSNSLTPQVTLQGATSIAPPKSRAAATGTRSHYHRELMLGGHPTLKAAFSANALRIGSFLATLAAVNFICGIERLQFHLAAHHPSLADGATGQVISVFSRVFAPVSRQFETFVLWFCTDLMDLGLQNLFDWRHAMMCFLFTVLISVAFFAIGSVIVDRMTKHGDVR